MDPGGLLVVAGIVAVGLGILALAIKGTLAQHRQRSLERRGPVIIDQPMPAYRDTEFWQDAKEKFAAPYKWAGIITAAPIAIAVWIFAISESGIIVGGIFGLIPAAIAGYITRWAWPVVWFVAFAFFIHPINH